jgi:hypothetical protein
MAGGDRIIGALGSIQFSTLAVLLYELLRRPPTVQFANDHAST